MTVITQRWSAGLLSGRSSYLALALLSLGFTIALARGAGSEELAVAPAASLSKSARNPPVGEDGGSGNKEQQRLREGTVLVDEVGYFKRAGDRAMFYRAGSKHGMGVLENLNLQRVIGRITDNTDQLDWVVTGKVTEYKNRNYLLINRVMLKNSVE